MFEIMAFLNDAEVCKVFSVPSSTMQRLAWTCVIKHNRCGSRSFAELDSVGGQTCASIVHAHLLGVRAGYFGLD